MGMHFLLLLLLLETLHEIKEPVTEIFKKSLQEGTVPNEWKLANIVPLHKKGSILAREL